MSIPMSPGPSLRNTQAVRCREHPRPGVVTVLALALALLAPAGPSWAHEYPVKGFKVIHPWCDEAPKGTAERVVSLRIVEVAAEDRLIAASTPVAESMELRRVDAQAAGVALRRGEDLSLDASTAHFVLRGVNTDLRFGQEYPLTLVFERAGEVPAALIVGEH
jgi:copper(I)-binding protein